MRTLLTGLAAVAVMAAAATAGSDHAAVAPQAGTPVPTPGGRAAAPAPRTGTGVLIGRVVEGESGRPVQGVLVSLTGSGATQKVQVDGQGRFLFTNLPDGEFQIGATKAGYFGGQSGQRAPKGPARPVALGAAERRGDLTLRLWKFAVIAGRVVGDNGEPAVGLDVNLIERRLVDGQRVMANRPFPTVTTDDRGAFRFSNVLPGEYLVLARTPADMGQRVLMAIAMTDPSAIASVASRAAGSGHIEDAVEIDSTLRVYPTTFYPSVMSPAEAEPIVVAAGEDRSGIDIRARVVGVGTVAGILTHQAQPVAGARLWLTTGAGEGGEVEVVSASTRPDGRFVMAGVPVGAYTLRATRIPAQTGAFAARGRATGQPVLPADPAVWATQPVVVGDAASRSMVIEAQAGARFRGRIEWSGAAPRPQPEQMANLRLMVVNAAPGPGAFPVSVGRIEADGTFTTVGLPPGRYRLRLDGPAPWRAGSATAEGVDLLDVPRSVGASDVNDVVITMIDTPTASLTGVVRDARGTPDPDAVVLVLPGDERLIGDRRMRTLRTTRDGAFSAPGLPAGDYVVVASDDRQVDAGLDRAAIVRLIQSGTRVTLNDGERKTVDLRGGSR